MQASPNNASRGSRQSSSTGAASSSTVRSLSSFEAVQLCSSVYCPPSYKKNDHFPANRVAWDDDTRNLSWVARAMSSTSSTGAWLYIARGPRLTPRSCNRHSVSRIVMPNMRQGNNTRPGFFAEDSEAKPRPKPRSLLSRAHSLPNTRASRATGTRI